jgi:hypothetical protein
MFAHQKAVMEKRIAAASVPAPKRPEFVMPKPHTPDQMMQAFIEDRQYDNDRIEKPGKEKETSDNVFDAMFDTMNSDGQEGGYRKFTGPGAYDPAFIRAQLAKEQPDEYVGNDSSDDDDSDPMGLYKAANSRVDGMMRSTFA